MPYRNRYIACLTVCIVAGALLFMVTHAAAFSSFGPEIRQRAITILNVAPDVAGFSPSSGPTGTQVILHGNYFLGTTGVTFNGATAAFSVLSNETISATVPVTATTGLIQVTNASGTTTDSHPFYVGSSQMSFALLVSELISLTETSAAWGDYDQDNDLDLIITGQVEQPSDPSGPTDTPTSTPTSGSQGIPIPVTKLYRFDGGDQFTDVTGSLAQVTKGEAAWGDYDNDGDLDLAISGVVANGGSVTKIYRNQGGNFVDIGAALPGFSYGFLAWGDYDNDGDLDLLAGGGTDRQLVTRLYQNQDGVFSEVSAGLQGAYLSDAAWGDYDNDGDLDILLIGWIGMKGITKIYCNDGDGTFTDINAGLTGFYNGTAAWGDYDNDGYLDILLAGSSSVGLKVYHNSRNGVFTEVSTGLDPFQNGSVDWGDADNDGDLDILLTGRSWINYRGMPISQVLINQGNGSFDHAYLPLPGIEAGTGLWGDYDGDGSLDILLGGSSLAQFLTAVYKNQGAPANMPPTSPGSLTANLSGHNVTLNWQVSNDDHTPVNGLSYNIRVGTTPGGQDIVAPMAELSSGHRHLPAQGNAYQRTDALLKNLPSGIYYWSVQAIDAAFAGSPFSAEASFFVSPPPTLGFDPNILSVSEQTASVNLTVRLAYPSSDVVTVNYQTQDGSAIAGEDYLATSGSLTFTPGITSQTLAITILADGIDEGDETFDILLSSPVNATLGPSAAANLTIIGTQTTNYPIFLPLITRDHFLAR